MITGGTGSFGTTVLKRFLSTDIKEIRIFSRDEKKQEDLRLTHNNPKLKFYIGDVRDINSLDFPLKGVDFLFHAAALKQVPSCEFFPIEAVRTNIMGTENVLNVAIKHQIKRVIVLSTDKAVYPINAMGMSKALMEKIMIAKARATVDNNTIMCVTRYGNVMASRGSVIPLFVDQIKAKKPLTITDPNMTRFLMSLDDSVDLVLHAFKEGNQGDTFVQKASACTILDLANALKEIFESKSPINLIGPRHGEKIYESLLSREEKAKALESLKYYQVPMDGRDLNYNNYTKVGSMKQFHADDYTSHNTVRLSIEEVKKTLLKLPYVLNRLKELSFDFSHQ